MVINYFKIFAMYEKWLDFNKTKTCVITCNIKSREVVKGYVTTKNNRKKMK